MNPYKLLMMGLFFIISSACWAQNDQRELPYYTIPDAPEEFNSHNVAARMVDGLGYRYYWATEELRDIDLKFQPSETSRTSMQTIVHIYNLSKSILNASTGQPNVSGAKIEEYSYKEYRKMTLENLESASNNMKLKTIGDMNDMKVIFKRGEKTSEFPFWNMINGPIADAIWHTGQVVAFRRASGNPLHPGVSVFSGKTKTN